jgi:uncharacterized membrane protein YkoI
MFAICRALFVLALGLGFVGSPLARADDKKGEGVKKPQPGAEPVKPVVIQIDASKLPPDVLKQLLQLAEKPKPTGEPVKPTGEGSKPAVKAISLTEAIAIAEKTAKGTATKAERQSEDGAVRFKIEVQDGKGAKTKLTLDAGGKVTGTEKKEGEDEKGEKKKKG